MTLNYVLPEFEQYKALPKIPRMDTVIWEWSLEQVQEWWDAAKEVEEFNRRVYRHNQETRALWRRIFEARGGKPWGARGTGSLKWFDTAMEALGYPKHSTPSVNDAWSYQILTLRGKVIRPYQAVNFSPCTLMDVWKGAHQQQEEWLKRQDGSS